MMHLRFLLAWIWVLSAVSFSQEVSLRPEEGRFLNYESINNHFDFLRSINGKVTAEAYLPKKGAQIELKLLEIPVSDLHVETSTPMVDGDRVPRIVEKGNYKFLIHPGSEKLYRPLIERYGVSGVVVAFPTASTRTLFVPKQAFFEQSVFVKTSLDDQQFGFGRVVSDWEVRRSVRMSRLLSRTSNENWRQKGLYIIPEFTGAYTKPSAELMTGVADNQPYLLEHGLIYRDASFLTDFGAQQVAPLFALLSEESGEAPLVVRWWRDFIQEHPEVSFESFFDERVVKPIVEALGFLVFHEGIHVDAHGQNLVVAFDPVEKRVNLTLLRDLGSMKVNWLLRMQRGLPVEDLLTSDIQWDFKPNWSKEIIPTAFYKYFNEYILAEKRGQAAIFRRHLPSYSPEIMKQKLDSHVQRLLAQYMPLKGVPKFRELDSGAQVSEWLEQYLSENPPKFVESGKASRHYVHQRTLFGQVIESLPPSWVGQSADLVMTNYGAIYRDGAKVNLALPTELKSKSIPQRFEVVVEFEQIRNSSWANHLKGSSKLKNHRFLAVAFNVEGKDEYLIVGRPKGMSLNNGRFREAVPLEVVLNISQMSQTEQREILSKIGVQLSEKLEGKAKDRCAAFLSLVSVANN